MSYNLLIQEYFDSGLDDAQQEALFGAMAKDQELRQEFNSHLRLDSITKMDMNSITPPTQVTSDIFKKLDFAIPSTKIGFWTKLNTAIVSVIVGLSLGSAGFYLANLKSDDSQNNQLAANIPVVSSSAIDNQTESNSNHTNNEILSGIESDNASNSQHRPNSSNLSNGESNRENLYSLNNSDSNKNQQESNSSHENENRKLNNQSDKVQGTLEDYLASKTYKHQFIDAESSRQYLISSKELQQSNDYKVGAINTVSFNNAKSNFSNNDIVFSNVNQADFIGADNVNYSSSNPFNINPDNTKWAVGFRQINQFSNQIDVNNENSVLMNRSVFVHYKFSSNLHFVAELGQEKFVQEFDRNIAGTAVSTLQNPLLNWYGFGAKYRFDGLFDQYFIAPFIQTVLAANSIGPIFRPTIGFDARINNYFTITTSYDRPILFYSVYGNNYTSFKDGLTIGFNFNF
jgi:hypothetical protein